MIEVSITVKDADQSLTQKHLVYEDNLVVSQDSEALQELVNSAIKAFSTEPTDVIVRMRYQWL